MQYRNLGNSGIAVSAIGLGCMGMSGNYGPADDAESVAAIGHALDIGMSFLDTSDAYGAGHNERIVGKALAGRRDDAVLATKVGIMDVPFNQPMAVSNDADYIRACCDASLSRLEIETIDIYYLHRMDADVPIEDTVGVMAELVAAGKIRHIGLSEVGADILRRAASVHPIAALQSEYSLWVREPEDEIIPTCRELGIGFVPFSPLGRGFLTGTVSDNSSFAEGDRRRAHPRFLGESFDANLALAAKVTGLAAAKGCTPAQLALAWLLHKGGDIAPIPGTRRAPRIDENAAAADIALTPEEIDEIERNIPRGAASGDRRPNRGRATAKA